MELDDQCLLSFRGGVDGGGQARRPGAKDEPAAGWPRRRNSVTGSRSIELMEFCWSQV
jgi:hypothetical protein